MASHTRRGRVLAAVDLLTHFNERTVFYACWDTITASNPASLGRTQSGTNMLRLTFSDYCSQRCGWVVPGFGSHDSVPN
jgi:hypothetical protein